MERHRCKLCRRRFSNGRALGGHMRSHAHPPPRPPSATAPRPLPSPSASSSSFSPAAEEEGTAAPIYGLRENPRRSFRLTDPEFSAGVGSSSVVQDGESDAESSLLLRPKHRLLAGDAEESPEEDVARCLMLLARDSWSRSEAEGHQLDCCDEGDGGRVERVAARSWQRRPRSRAGQKRARAECAATVGFPIQHGEGSSDANATDRDVKLFQCPYCCRVFSSGQALGGHKRSHFATAAASATTSSPAPRPLPPPRSVSSLAANNSSIDLILPNPSSSSEAEISAVSVAAQFASK